MILEDYVILFGLPALVFAIAGLAVWQLPWSAKEWEEVQDASAYLAELVRSLFR
jgi:hypothetical protein